MEVKKLPKIECLQQQNFIYDFFFWSTSQSSFTMTLLIPLVTHHYHSYWSLVLPVSRPSFTLDAGTSVQNTNCGKACLSHIGQVAKVGQKNVGMQRCCLAWIWLLGVWATLTTLKPLVGIVRTPLPESPLATVPPSLPLLLVSQPCHCWQHSLEIINFINLAHFLRVHIL